MNSFGSGGQKLILNLIIREIGTRYRGSFLGLGWSLLTPLLMLGVYTWTFGTVFQSRWQQASGSGTHAEPPTGEFALILFSGLILFGLFTEVVNRAPSLIVSNANYVKKVVFPLEILPVVATGSALFNAAVSLGVLFIFMIFIKGGIPATALLLPLIIAPLLLLTLGLGWFLAAFGVYVRDIGQLLGPLTTALMFLTPIFFPLSSLPPYIRVWIFLNPLALPVEQVREVLIWGRLPDFAALALYAAVAAAVAWLGYTFFQKTRRGFADVL